METVTGPLGSFPRLVTQGELRVITCLDDRRVNVIESGPCAGPFCVTCEKNRKRKENKIVRVLFRIE